MIVPVALVVLADAAIKSTIVLLLVLVLAAGLRRASAAARHFLWAAALSAVVILPLLSLAMPWRVTVPLPGSPIAERLASLRSEGRLAAPETLQRVDAQRVPPTDAAAVRGEAPRARLGLAVPFPDGATPWAILGVAWLVGVAVVALRLGLGWAVVARVTRRGTSLLGTDSWCALMERVARRVGVDRPVRLVIHDKTPMPFTAGLFRPVVVLPAEAQTWNEERRTAVLLHELAHLRRADVVAHLIAQAATALYWFNPLVWVAARKLRAEGERACDDLVLRAGTKPSHYAGHLLEIVRHARRSWAPAIALPMAQRSEFEGRVLAILEARARRTGLTRPTSFAVGLVVVATAAPIASLSPAWRDVGDEPSARSTRVVHRATPSLISDLRASDAEARRAAARELGKREDAAAIPALTRALDGDSDAGVRSAAARALGRIEDASAVDALVDALGDDDPRVRYEAARAIGELEVPRAPQELLDALRDADPRVRRGAARAADEIEDPAAVGPLSLLLHDPDARTRRAAVRALEEIETPAALEALRTALDDRDADIRRLAAKALDEEGK